MKVKREKIACPYCGHEQEIETYENIDIDIDEGMREKIMSEEILTFKCEECGEKAITAFPCLVSNLEKRYIFWLLANFNDEQKEELDREFEESMKDKKDKEFAEGYQRRIVGSVNELKEKILLADVGLDDRVMEIVKMLCVSEVSDQLKGEQLSEVRFNQTKDGQMFLVLVFIDRGPAMIDLTQEMYEKVAKMFANDIEKMTPKEGFAEIDPFWASSVIDQSIVITN